MIVAVKRKQRKQIYDKLVLIAGAALFFSLGIIFAILYEEFVKPEEPKLLPTQVTGGLEIERKWLLDLGNLPVNLKKEAAGIWEIYQTYINFSPEMRVRKIVDQSGKVNYTMTVKADMSVDGLTRSEKEWYISEEEYGHLLTKAEGGTIYKTRYSIEKGDLRYEYDIFHGQLDGLAYLEIEFTSEEAAREFKQPSYVVKDVTSDKRYKNQGLAQYGAPKD